MVRVTLDEFLRLQKQTEKAYLIMREELKKSSIMFKQIEAYIFPDIKTTGIKGDQRVYQYPIFFAVHINNGELFLDYEILGRISTRLTNELEDVTRVVYMVLSTYDLTHIT